MNLKPFLIFCLFLIFVLSACDDMHDQPDFTDLPESAGEITGLYILCEGLMDMNNSTLAYYSFADRQLEKKYFQKQNKRGLGDTANDMKSYGSKLYIVVNISSQIEVVDLLSGRSLRQIPFITESGRPRDPRFITFWKDKAYVCSFDGTVARIDTATLEIEAYTNAGRNPDGICAVNNKLYVSNSGGLDAPDYDHTVSVIDISRFQEVKKIEVGINPYTIAPDADGDIYLVSRGNYQDSKYALQMIDSRSDELIHTFTGLEVLNFTIAGDYAYLYTYDFNNQNGAVKLFNVCTEQLERENFITDGTAIDTPYGIDVDRVNGDIYITDARSFTVWGNLYCFDREGKLKFKLTNVGVNPNTTVCLRK